MRILKTGLFIALALAWGGSSATAGSINATIGGSSNATLLFGEIVSIDVSITIGAGDTPISPAGSTGAGYEISFISFGGGTASLGTNTVIPGWFPLPTGPCVGGSCANAVVAGNLFPSAGSLAPGTYFLGSVTLDTTGMAPGVHVVEFNLSGPGDAIFAAVGVDVSSEYVSVGATLTFIPEPGTAALMALGLAVLGVTCRRR